MSRILLIEDNESNRDMLSRRLRRAGFDVAVAADAASGIDLAIARPPHLILMDLRLGQMSGWDAMKVLRADSRTATTCIIALSAYAMENDRQRALTTGADDYDTKPVDFPRLMEKIAMLLEHRSHHEPGTTPTPKSLTPPPGIP